METEAKIIDLLLHIQKDVTEIKSDITGLKVDVNDLKADVLGLKTDVNDLKADVSGLKTDVNDLKDRVATLEENQQVIHQNLLRFENEQTTKTKALFDAFELRGDQIVQLHTRMEDRLNSVQLDNAFTLSKIAQYEKNLAQLNNSNRLGGHMHE